MDGQTQEAPIVANSGTDYLSLYKVVDGIYYLATHIDPLLVVEVPASTTGLSPPLVVLPADSLAGNDVALISRIALRCFSLFLLFDTKGKRHAPSNSSICSRFLLEDKCPFKRIVCMTTRNSTIHIEPPPQIY